MKKHLIMICIAVALFMSFAIRTQAVTAHCYVDLNLSDVGYAPPGTVYFAQVQVITLWPSISDWTDYGYVSTGTITYMTNVLVNNVPYAELSTHDSYTIRILVTKYPGGGGTPERLDGSSYAAFTVISGTYILTAFNTVNIKFQ